MRTLDAAYIINNQVRYSSPYKTGNLRNRGITSPYMLPFGAIGFDIGRNAEYGINLNEYPILKRKTKDGVLRIYNNRHYQWIDKNIDIAVRQIAAKVGGIVVRG